MTNLPRMESLPPIIAVDPGGTTGLCIYRPINDLLRLQLTKPQHHADLVQVVKNTYFNWVDEHGQKAEKVVVVCENFEFRRDDRGRDKIEYISAEYVGALKALAQQQNPVIELVLQSPSLRNQFFTDDVLKKLGVWIPNMRHAMDATQHYLYYRTFTLKDHFYLHQLKENHG